MKIAWIQTLERLLARGTIPASSMSAKMRQDIEHWGQQTGCLRLARQGRGLILECTSPKILAQALSKWRSAESPSPTDASEHPRAQALARSRSTKSSLKVHDTQYFLAKVLSRDLKVERIASQDRPDAHEGTTPSPLELGALQAELGCLALAIHAQTLAWQCSQSLILIENQALFDDTSWIPSEFGLVIYYRGQLSHKLLHWLKAGTWPQIVLFPDFDGVGLQNFARLHTQIPTAKWFWPLHWQDALVKYGNPELWQTTKQKTLFEQVWMDWSRCGFPDPELKHLMTQMREQGRMLEQEWIFL
jgi:hypothetical protein